jgi:hypothetical protein
LLLPSFQSRDAGVGHNPDSLPSVRGIDGTSRNNKRLDPIAKALQVRKHLVEFHADDSRHVLTKHPSGLASSNNVAHCRPEMTVVFRASSLPGKRVRLAGKTSGNEIASNNWNCSNVSEVGHLGPVLFEDLARIRIDFAEANGSEPSAMSGNGEAPDAAEKVEMGWLTQRSP